MILLSLLFLVIGFLMLRFPEEIYDLTESWKSNTHPVSLPSGTGSASVSAALPFCWQA